MDALILSCGTGGGHDAAARAVKDELLRRGERVVMLNPYMLHSSRLAEWINHAYISLVQNVPLCFGAIYKLGEAYRKLPCRSPIYFLNGKMVPIMKEYLEQNHFDIVIMTHLFPAEIMTQMKNHGISIPKTIFIATDYTCIPFTEDTECDAYIIPARELYCEFQNKGIPPEKIVPLGIPVQNDFVMQISKEEARDILRMEKDKKYLLVSGGSIGAGKLSKAVKYLYEQCDDTMRLIVVCGNNKTLYKKLLKKYGNAIDIIQSTDKMAAYLRASDLYFTKPGGLSSTEAAVMGIPLIHLPPIPGCETKNARFFCVYGMNYPMAVTKPNIKKAVSIMGDASKCTEMILKQHEIIRSDSASCICTLAEKLMEKES